MNMDKALIEIDGEACISRVINALNKAGSVPITISISNLDLIDSYSQIIDSSIEIEWSVDKKKFAGPIESIIENLEKFAGNEDFIQLATVDVPWVTEEFFIELRNSIKSGDDLIMPTDGKNIHPLLALIRPKNILRKVSDGNNRPLRIQFSELKHSLYFENKAILKNINYPHDLE